MFLFFPLLAFWRLGFLASGLFGFLLVYAAFGGFLAFASSAFPVPLRQDAAFGGCWRLWEFCFAFRPGQ